MDVHVIMQCLNGGSVKLASRLVKQGFPPRLQQVRFSVKDRRRPGNEVVQQDDLCDNLYNIFAIFTIYIYIKSTSFPGLLFAFENAEERKEALGTRLYTKYTNEIYEYYGQMNIIIWFDSTS